MAADQPNVAVYRVDDRYFVLQTGAFVLVGTLMSIGPSVLAWFWPHTRVPLISAVVVLASLIVLLVQSAEPEYMLSSLIEFLPPFGLGVSVPFLLGYLLEKRFAANT